MLKVKKHTNIPSSVVEVIGVSEGRLSTEPGIMVSNSISKCTGSRVPVLVVNSTTKSIKLRRGNVTA